MRLVSVREGKCTLIEDMVLGIVPRSGGYAPGEQKDSGSSTTHIPIYLPHAPTLHSML